MMRKYVVAAIAAVALTGSVQAAKIAPGTLGVAVGGAPTVTLTGAQGTFSVNAATIDFGGAGGFSTGNGFGLLSGTFDFAKTEGTTVAASLSNFLTFGAFSFSATSVKTLTYSVVPGTSVSASVYLLGSVIAPGFEATPTSMTLSFNQTGTSTFSSSATLATPPSLPSVPEPASWAMMLVGFGAMGAAMRRRRTSVSFG